MARNGTVSGLTARQERFLATLLATPSTTAAAEQSGVAIRTAWRWLRDPEFQATLWRHRREMLSAATGGLVAASGEAVETLRAAMSEAGAPLGTRVHAAKTILDCALRAVETEELAVKLDAMERTLDGLATI